MLEETSDDEGESDGVGGVALRSRRVPLAESGKWRSMWRPSNSPSFPHIPESLGKEVATLISVFPASIQCRLRCTLLFIAPAVVFRSRGFSFCRRYLIS